MKKQANRKAIVISAALTLLVLLGTGGVVFANRLAAAGELAAPVQGTDNRQAPMPATGAVAVAPANGEIVAAYQAQLQDAYQALNNAYAQIETLQAAQQPDRARSFGEHEDHESQEHSSGLALFNRGHDDD